MKKGMLFFVFILLSNFGYGQFGPCDGPAVNYIGPIDSTNFSGGQTSKFHLQIDTSMVKNIWQIGSVSKTGFPASIYGGQAIQTDTLNNYDSLNTSAFMVWTDSNYTWPGWQDSVHSITFWHYYDVDSLGDSCSVQMTIDSGDTWLEYSDIGNQIFMWMSYDYNVPNYLEPSISGKFLWTGKSAGWQRVKICFMYPLPLKPIRTIDRHFGFRFLFNSDSLQTNKPGWMIDKIHFSSPIAGPGSVKDFQRKALPIYPNPSNNGEFTIDFPSNYVTGKFFVYDYLGRNVKTVELKEHIDLSDLPEGLYSYKAVFEKTNQWFSGKIEIR